MRRTTILVRQPDRSIVAELDRYSKATIIPRFNAVGAWALEIDRVHCPPELLEPQAGIVVVRDGVVVLSGIWTTFRRTIGAEDTIVLGGVDDLVWLENRDSWPDDPTAVGDGSHTFATDYATYSGVGSTVLRDLVNDNAASGAFTGRPVPGLVLAADPVIGDTVDWSVRFDQLLPTLQAVALAAGDIGFEVVHDGATPALTFNVYDPVDRSAEVVFSRDLGNLSEAIYDQARPTATHPVVAGQGEGTARIFVLAADAPTAAIWGRVERFVDQRNAATVAELQSSAVEALAKGSGTVGIALTPVDTEGVTYGVDYGLGDRVTVEVEGVPIVDTVREVRLELSSDGETIRPGVGTPGALIKASVPDQLAAAVRAVKTDAALLAARR